MKAEIIHKNSFSPVTIEITIESIDELHALYARINAPQKDVKKHYHESCADNSAFTDLYKLYHTINDIIHTHYSNT